MKAAIGPWQWSNENGMIGWIAPKGAVSTVDLRAYPDCCLANQYGDYPYSLFLFWDGVPIDENYYILGEDRIDQIKPDNKARQYWNQVFGGLPEGDTVADWLIWQLTNGSVPDGSAPCKPLLPTKEGICEIHIPWHSVIRKWKFGEWNPEGNTYHNRVRDLLRLDMMKMLQTMNLEKNQSKAFSMSKEELDKVPGKVLESIIKKYGCKANDIIEGIEPIEPTTTIIDDFNRSDGPTIGNQLTWDKVFGSFSTVANKVRLDTVGGDSERQTCRAIYDLSSSDHYSQVAGYNFYSWVGQCATTARFSSSANICYRHMRSPYNANHYSQISKIINNTNTNIATGTTSTHPADGDIIKLECSGSTISGYVNDATGTSVTDTSISIGLRVGFSLYRAQSSVDPQIDNFEASDGGSDRPPAEIRPHVIGASLGYRRNRKV